MNTIFLWPTPRDLALRHFIGKPIQVEAIESLLRSLYPDAEPVLFSSARAGLCTILEHLQLTRPDLVWCPPFSSHCVLDAISRNATPTTLPSPEIRAAVVYHQWGYVHSHSFRSGVEVIEDAVDTLFVPGTNPFAVDGRYVLWSLPKAIESRFGGVVFCRNHGDANGLRRCREHRSLPATTQALLRLAGERFPPAAIYWHGAEARGALLPCFALRQIEERLESIQALVEPRRAKTLQFLPYSLYPAPDMDRLPSNVPVTLSTSFQISLKAIDNGRFSAGVRHTNLQRHVPSGDWVRAAPIPVHSSAEDSALGKVKNLLGEEFSKP